MDFSLTDEHRMAQQMVREFAQKEVTPIIKEYDRNSGKLNTHVGYNLCYSGYR